MLTTPRGEHHGGGRRRAGTCDRRVGVGGLGQHLRDAVQLVVTDDGVPAAFINYQLNSSRTAGDYKTRIANNLGLRNGINLGAWRLRNESNLSGGTDRSNTFTSNRKAAPDMINRLSPEAVYQVLTEQHPKAEARRYLYKVNQAEKGFKRTVAVRAG